MWSLGVAATLAGTDGPLFRGRYKASVVDADAYLLNVSRYIHRNPIDASPALIDAPPRLAVVKLSRVIHRTERDKAGASPQPLWIGTTPSTATARSATSHQSSVTRAATSRSWPSAINATRKARPNDRSAGVARHVMGPRWGLLNSTQADF